MSLLVGTHIQIDKAVYDGWTDRCEKEWKESNEMWLSPEAVGKEPVVTQLQMLTDNMSNLHRTVNSTLPKRIDNLQKSMQSGFRSAVSEIKTYIRDVGGVVGPPSQQQRHASYEEQQYEEDTSHFFDNTKNSNSNNNNNIQSSSGRRDDGGARIDELPHRSPAATTGPVLTQTTLTALVGGSKSNKNSDVLMVQDVFYNFYNNDLFIQNNTTLMTQAERDKHHRWAKLIVYCHRFLPPNTVLTRLPAGRGEDVRAWRSALTAISMKVQENIVEFQNTNRSLFAVDPKKIMNTTTAAEGADSKKMKRLLLVFWN